MPSEDLSETTEPLYSQRIKRIREKLLRIIGSFWRSPWTFPGSHCTALRFPKSTMGIGRPRSTNASFFRPLSKSNYFSATYQGPTLWHGQPSGEQESPFVISQIVDLFFYNLIIVFDLQDFSHAPPPDFFLPYPVPLRTSLIHLSSRRYCARSVLETPKRTNDTRPDTLHSVAGSWPSLHCGIYKRRRCRSHRIHTRPPCRCP